MKLVSDFSDVYDLAFDGQGPAFRRVTTDGPTRREMFPILEAAGFKTPPHGSVADILKSWWAAEGRWVKQVVAYEDEGAHRGEGKCLWDDGHVKWDGCVNRIAECYRREQLFCTAYVGPYPWRPGLSWRLLQVGSRRFWLEYTSLSDWRSNVGDGDITLLGEEDPFSCEALPYPLYAIDFVLGREAYAIDLNVAPGVRGTGIERVISPKAFVEELERAL